MTDAFAHGRPALHRPPRLNGVDPAALFNASPNPYLILDPAFGIVDMNDAYLDVTMRRREDLVGRNLFEAFPSDPGAPNGRLLRASLARVLREKTADHIPLIRYAIAAPDGTLEDRYWSATQTPIFGGGGEVAFILHHAVDVTELHRLRQAAGSYSMQVETGVLRRAEAVQTANEELDEERRRLRRLFEQAPGFIAILRGPRHVFDLANAAYLQLVGHRDIAGKPVGEALPEVEGQGFFELLDRVYAAGEPYVGRGVRVRLQPRPDEPPEERHLDFVYQPITGAAGEVTGIFVQGHDITEQKRAEDAVREETRALEILNRTGAVVAVETDLEQLVQAVTDAGVELTGAEFGAFFYNVENDSGESYMLYTLSGAPREAFAKFPMPRNTSIFGPTFRGEGIVRSDDVTRDPRYGRNEPYRGMPEGHLPVRSYLAVPVVSRAGEVIGGLFFGHGEPGVFTERAEHAMRGLAGQAAIAIANARLFQRAQHEIEERRRAEQALQDLNSTLEQQVAERTEQLRLNEEQLRQAQKMEAVGQLTGGIAHDFNNLLQIIAGNLEILQRRLPPDSARLVRAADTAMNGARRAATLTQRLLAFSRRQPLAPQPIEVNGLVSGMSELLRRTLGEAIRLETVLAGGLWRVEADPNQLESAILNLAVNARDAMPEGGILTLETANAPLDRAEAARRAGVLPGPYVLVCIRDTGVGMDEATAARAFEPFFTTKEIGKGTGLGLSQVYGFVKQSGGHVQIDSEPGEGTAVRIYLPRLAGAAGEEAAAEERAAPAGTREETVLVVEDDDDVRTYSVEMLRELGYRVIEAHDGPAALRLLERQDASIDLLFSDVALPGGMTGAQLAAEARTRRAGIKVLFTTGYARDAIVHHGRLDPGVELITKPFTYADLAARVRGVLDSGASGCSGAGPRAEA